jgi:hypothetical protein
MKKRYIVLILIIFIFSISSVSAGIFNSLLGDQSPIDEENDIELGNVTLRTYAIEALDTQEYLTTFKSEPETYNNNDTINWLENLEGHVILPSKEGDYLVMNASYASELPVVEEDIDEVSFNKITCNITEAHSLGNGLIDLILVEDVKLVDTETKNLFSDYS